MTNVNQLTVRKLYENTGAFDIEKVTRYSSISGLTNGRQQYSELIISANLKEDNQFIVKSVNCILVRYIYRNLSANKIFAEDKKQIKAQRRKR